METYLTPEQVKHLRLQLGLSIAQLADRLRMTDIRTVRRWETGERPISGPASIALWYMAHGRHPDD